MTEIERTIVKSPPEVWELIDDEGFIVRWTCALAASSEEIAVEIHAREAGRSLRWRGTAEHMAIAVELEIAEKGWGTCVSIRTNGTGERADANAVLEGLLDELSSANRRPFSRS